MIYDKPAQVVWVASLTASGYVNSNFLKVIDNSNPASNIVNKYTDLGYNAVTPSNYYLNTNILYSITDNNFNTNLKDFAWNFVGYKGPIYSSTAMVAVNYFNNYTANEIEITLNNNNQTISPPFYFDPYDPYASPTGSKTIIVPAGAQNFPIPLWVKPSEGNNTVTFTCLLYTNPTLTINGTASFTA